MESGADDVVDAVKQRGGGPKPPQELAVRESGAAIKKRGDEEGVTREALEASIATAVASGYVCAMCVHRKVGCGCPQYEAKMAALMANRRRETAGNNEYTNSKNIGVLMVIALVVFLYWRLVWDYLEKRLS